MVFEVFKSLKSLEELFENALQEAREAEERFWGHAAAAREAVHVAAKAEASQVLRRAARDGSLVEVINEVVPRERLRTPGQCHASDHSEALWHKEVAQDMVSELTREAVSEAAEAMREVAMGLLQAAKEGKLESSEEVAELLGCEP